MGCHDTGKTDTVASGQARHIRHHHVSRQCPRITRTLLTLCKAQQSAECVCRPPWLWGAAVSGNPPVAGVQGQVRTCRPRVRSGLEKAACGKRRGCALKVPCLPRDGPDQNSPQLGIFSGNTALETAYSSTNQVLLKFHSDFSNGGFFVLNFHGQCVFTPRAKWARYLGLRSRRCGRDFWPGRASRFPGPLLEPT